MKIRITGSQYPQSWYAKRFGDVFEVLEQTKDCNGNKIYVVHWGRVTNSFVDARDCIEVQENGLTEQEEIDNLRALQSNHQRWFTQDEFDRLKYLIEKNKSDRDCHNNPLTKVQ